MTALSEDRPGAFFISKRSNVEDTPGKGNLLFWELPPYRPVWLTHLLVIYPFLIGELRY